MRECTSSWQSNSSRSWARPDFWKEDHREVHPDSSWRSSSWRRSARIRVPAEDDEEAPPSGKPAKERKKSADAPRRPTDANKVGARQAKDRHDQSGHRFRSTLPAGAARRKGPAAEQGKQIKDLQSQIDRLSKQPGRSKESGEGPIKSPERELPRTARAHSRHLRRERGLGLRPTAGRFQEKAVRIPSTTP